MQQLKGAMQDLESELADLQSMYDKDKALWEGKCKFLENQKCMSGGMIRSRANSTY